jgi:hypothetical protein
VEGDGDVEPGPPWFEEELLQENNRKEQNMTLEPRKYFTIPSETNSRL